jgi:vacuolar protein sorting-associated protein 13A/C
LERTNIDLQIQHSIVPDAFNLARFKVSGELPTLQVNLSDMKYRSLLGLIDVCIPTFSNSSVVENLASSTLLEHGGEPFQLSRGLFGNVGAEYNIEDYGSDEDGDGSSSQDEQYFEADDGNVKVRASTYICVRL